MDGLSSMSNLMYETMNHLFYDEHKKTVLPGFDAIKKRDFIHMLDITLARCIRAKQFNRPFDIVLYNKELTCPCRFARHSAVFAFRSIRGEHNAFNDIQLVALTKRQADNSRSARISTRTRTCPKCDKPLPTCQIAVEMLLEEPRLFHLTWNAFTQRQQSSSSSSSSPISSKDSSLHKSHTYGIELDNLCSRLAEYNSVISEEEKKTKNKDQMDVVEEEIEEQEEEEKKAKNKDQMDVVEEEIEEEEEEEEEETEDYGYMDFSHELIEEDTPLYDSRPIIPPTWTRLTTRVMLRQLVEFGYIHHNTNIPNQKNIATIKKDCYALQYLASLPRTTINDLFYMATTGHQNDLIITFASNLRNNHAMRRLCHAAMASESVTHGHISSVVFIDSYAETGPHVGESPQSISASSSTTTRSLSSSALIDIDYPNHPRRRSGENESGDAPSSLLSPRDDLASPPVIYGVSLISIDSHRGRVMTPFQSSILLLRVVAKPGLVILMEGPDLCIAFSTPKQNPSTTDIRRLLPKLIVHRDVSLIRDDHHVTRIPGYGNYSGFALLEIPESTFIGGVDADADHQSLDETYLEIHLPINDRSIVTSGRALRNILRHVRCLIYTPDAIATPSQWDIPHVDSGPIVHLNDLAIYRGDRVDRILQRRRNMLHIVNDVEHDDGRDMDFINDRIVAFPHGIEAPNRKVACLLFAMHTAITIQSTPSGNVYVIKTPGLAFPHVCRYMRYRLSNSKTNLSSADDIPLVIIHGYPFELKLQSTGMGYSRLCSSGPLTIVPFMGRDESEKQLVQSKIISVRKMIRSARDDIQSILEIIDNTWGTPLIYGIPCDLIPDPSRTTTTTLSSSSSSIRRFRFSIKE